MRVIALQPLFDVRRLLTCYGHSVWLPASGDESASVLDAGPNSEHHLTTVRQGASYAYPGDQLETPLASRGEAQHDPCRASTGRTRGHQGPTKTPSSGTIHQGVYILYRLLFYAR